MVPIWTVYIFSIKCRHRYPNRFSISGPIGPLYTLSIINLYRYLYTKSIWITYKIAYKGSLYFGIPDVCLEVSYAISVLLMQIPNRAVHIQPFSIVLTI